MGLKLIDVLVVTSIKNYLGNTFFEPSNLKIQSVICINEGEQPKLNLVNSNEQIFFPQIDPTKYFGCELGAQTQFDVKNDRYIVNGSHEANKLQDMLDGFIKKFVLCPECENPETDLVSAFEVFVSKRKNCICFCDVSKLCSREGRANIIFCRYFHTDFMLKKRNYFDIRLVF